MRSRTILTTMVFFLASLCLAGCGGPLKYRYEPPPLPGAMSPAGPASVFVEPFKDTRDLEDKRAIGDIKATVANISGTRLVLAEEPSTAVTRAFEEELASAGYNLETAALRAEYILGGEVREFRLDIASRDDIAIELAVDIREAATGRPVWSGVVAEEESRYAGVLGNSRGTISRYISDTLAKVVRKTLAEAGESLSPTGETPAPPAISGAGEKKAEMPSKTGRLSITTEPPRAKVYLGDVYYGLTPITLDMEAGVYELTIRLEGYDDFEERVAVGAGRTTELETNLESE